MEGVVAYVKLILAKVSEIATHTLGLRQHHLVAEDLYHNPPVV